MKKKHLLTLFLMLFISNHLFAQTWTGATSTDWNTASNWSPAAVPTASGDVTIPGSLTNYPVLASNVTINSINMAAGSKLDFKGHTLDITSNNHYNYFTGATLNNSDGGSDIVINLNTGVGGYASYLRSTTINDNITFNLNGPNNFYEADGGGTANTFNGNAIFNIINTLSIFLSHGDASQYKKNLTINRTVAGGSTQLFNGGGNVTGNFKFTNNLDGNFTIGNLANPTSINGQIDITIKNATPAPFTMYHIKNQTGGGSIDVQNSLGLDVQKDTLLVSSMSITGYQGNAYATLYNNDITGDLVLASDANFTGGYGNYIRANLITGDATFTINGTDPFYEADAAGSGNHFTGNVNYNIASTAIVQMSHLDTSFYDGNLTIMRTAAGGTQAFNSGGVIGGNLSFTNNSGGGVTFGNASNLTSIGGKIDMMVNYLSPDVFTLHRLRNQITGGNINVQNSLALDVQKDTLLVSSMSITGYQGNAYATLYNNDITGDLVLASDADFKYGYGSYIRSNLITGDATFTINGTDAFYEADAAGSGNHFTGNVNYTIASTAIVQMSHLDTSFYDGNLTIMRTAAGGTQAFNSGGIIGGNLSFTNSSGGGVTFGNASNLTSIGGKIDMMVNYLSPDVFTLHRLRNQTTGGNINVQNSLGLDVRKDTLLVSSMSITGYQGNAYATLYNNDITGNLTLASDVNHNGGYGSYIRNNYIDGDATFTNNAPDFMVESDGANYGNHYTGNVTFNKNGTGALSVGSGDTTSIGGGLALNSNAISLGNIQFTDNNDGVVKQTSGDPIVIPTLIMNKAGTAKVSLKSRVKVTGNLNFISGIIGTDATNVLELPDNMSYLGGSDSSYVDGPVMKTGNDAFTFPVGQNNKYAPITITAPAAATDAFTAEYIEHAADDEGYDSTKLDAGIDHISMEEYWMLNRTAGSSNVTVTLGWDGNRSGTVDDIPNLRIARWDGAKWKNEGNGGTAGTISMGTIKTASALGSFGPFTLASANAMNPLPINISGFSAHRQSSTVVLNWQTENEVNFSHFDVERAGSDNHFVSIGKVIANNISSAQSYSLEDQRPLKGTNLYRLKLIDRDGKVAYSKVVSVNFNERSMITIYPNPARDYIQVDGVKDGLPIEINDASGKLVKRFISNTSSRYVISDLRKGLYFVKIHDKENSTVTKLIIE